jgi:predicted outer membrane repeat protein
MSSNAKNRAVLSLQALEGRDIPATFTVGTAAGEYLTLSGAVTAANAAGGANTVNFDKANPAAAQTLVGQIALSSNITIDGTNAPAITAAATKRIFEVVSNTATIENFAAGILTPNGAVKLNGGIILVDGPGSLALLNVTLSGGNATNGGAVEFDGLRLLVDSSTFTNDNTGIQQIGNGGAFNIAGGADGVLIRNSTFGAKGQSNTAAYGGAIAAFGVSPTTTTVQLLSDTFAYNGAFANPYNKGNGGYGGAIATNDSLVVGVTGVGLVGPTNLPSTFTNDAASDIANLGAGNGGGAIYWAPASSGNESLNVSATTFSGNQGQQGGAIYASVNVSSGTQTESITQSTFVGNKSLGAGTNGYGGAVYLSSVTTGTASAAATLTNDTFNGNSAANHGGAVAISANNQNSSGTNTASLTSLTVTGNKATTDGGGVWIGAGTVNFDNDILDGNKSNGATPQDLGIGTGGKVGIDRYNLVGTTELQAGVIGKAKTDQVNDTPGLNALAANGPANYPQTQLVMATSPAWHAGDPALVKAKALDENNLPRTNANNNIGAAADQTN